MGNCCSIKNRQKSDRYNVTSNKDQLNQSPYKKSFEEQNKYEISKNDKGFSKMRLNRRGSTNSSREKEPFELTD